MRASRVYRVTAIILKRTNVGEADSILTIFSKTLGKLRVIAKGIRKISSRRGPHMELFNEVSLVLHQGKSMDSVGEAVTLRSLREGLSSSWIRMRAAYCIVETLDKLVPIGSDQEQLYDELRTTLGILSSCPEDKISSYILMWCTMLCQTLGFLPKDKPFPNFLVAISTIERIAERKILTAKFFVTI